MLALEEQPAVQETPLPQGRTGLRESFARRQKVVVVHAGGRDQYQLAAAFAEVGLLERLITDFYWSGDSRLSTALTRLLPPQVLGLLQKRSAPGLPHYRVTTSLLAGLQGLFLDKLKFLPFALRQKLVRSADAWLGRMAGNVARRTHSTLVSYSYYGYDAFRAFRQPGILFQMHPHPLTMRRILREELAAHPDCAPSLLQEWELALPEADFERLVREAALASHHLVASSFTRRSLVENGVSADRITVIPYGINLERFYPDPARALTRTPTLQLLFVGRINQRKGLKYLLEALRLLQGKPVKLTVCGRVIDDLSLFEPFQAQVDVRPSVSQEELLLAYQSADLFVFPSVGEGFGQVLLEALACGLPILSTTHTAAPDLIEDGVQGFIVEPRDPALLAQRIDWALTHRRELGEMGQRARERAEEFTWARFRYAAVDAVARASAEPVAPRPGTVPHA